MSGIKISSSSDALTNTLYSFDLKTYEWKKLKCYGDIPSRREFHCCILHHEDIYIFGGYDGTVLRNDWYAFNIPTSTWRKIDAIGDIPIPRKGATAVLHEGIVYLFAGIAQDVQNNTSTCCNDLYQFIISRSEWSKVHASGQIPSKRHLHSSVVYKNQMFVFGGRDNYGFKLSDLHVLHLSTHKWIKLTQVTDSVPSKRDGHVASVIGDCMIVFGGMDKSSNYLQDVYSFHFPTQIWKKLKIEVMPQKRYAHASVANQLNVFIFGGECYEQVNEIGPLDINGNFTIKVDKLDFLKESWKTIGGSGNIPANRRGHSVVMNDNFAYLFGGMDFLQKVTNEILEKTKLLLDDKRMVDITFQIGKTLIPVHKCIVSQSPYLDNLIKNHKNNQPIKIENCSEKIFKQILNYLYSGEILLEDSKMFVEIIQAAETFQIK